MAYITVCGAGLLDQITYPDQSTKTSLGGGGVNIAANLGTISKLAAEKNPDHPLAHITRLRTAVGEELQQFIKNFADQFDIDTESVEFHPSPSRKVSYNHNGTEIEKQGAPLLTTHTELGAGTDLSPIDIINEHIVIGVDHPDRTMHTIEECMEQNKPYYFVIGGNAKRLNKTQIRQGVRNSLGVICNESELSNILATTKLTTYELLELIAKVENPFIIKTLGSEGSELYTKHTKYRNIIPPFAGLNNDARNNSTADTIGCGDAFSAGFISVHTATNDLNAAARVGSYLGALANQGQTSLGHTDNIRLATIEAQFRKYAGPNALKEFKV